MKIWQSYGAEHSQNLVVIGNFKLARDAENFKRLIDKTTEFIRESPEFDVDEDRFSSNIMDYLSKQNIYSLSPSQLGSLLYDFSIELDGNNIRIHSDDDLNSLITLLISKGAKVEVFSAHDYPETETETEG